MFVTTESEVRTIYKIVTKNGTTHLYQDDVELHGIKSISFTHDAITDKPELKVIFTGDNIEIDAYCVPELPEFYKPFYQEIEKIPQNEG